MPSPVDSLIQHFLITGEIPASTPSQELSVLSIAIAPEILGAGIVPALTKSYVFSAGIIPLLEPISFWMRRHDLGLTVCSEHANDLLLMALQIQAQNHGLPLSMGLAHGNGLVLDTGEWIAVARMQADRMAQIGGHHQITASMPFIQSLEALPEGIGGLPLNRSTLELIGFSAVLIRDFRSLDQ